MAPNASARPATPVNGKGRGFTLIEVMIVLAIVAILASIAYPSYVGFVTKSKRATGKTQMVNIAQMQERYYIDNRTYGTLSNLGFAADTIGVADNGKIVAAGAGIYDITITPAPTATSYVVQATATKGQTADAGCTVLTLDATGAQNPPDCWQ